MAAKVRLNELDGAMVNQAGAPAGEQALRERARALVAAAQAALPDGLPATSPYCSLTATEVVAEAARYNIRLGPFMTENELRLVTEYARQENAKPRTGPTREPQPPTAHQPVVPLKIRGLKPSPSNTWRVGGIPEGKRKSVNVGRGQMASFGNGAIVEARHYSPQILQGMIDQGMKLEPIEDPEPEE